MLQRAASNAYSWWCASHIRTNQSKWLDGNLQEMEGRVQAMLKIIEEDADSFARRAEMYYKRRPELINFVEETYRAYRALAERFDHVSGELHKANHTLATAFPDVQFQMQDDEYDNPPEGFPSTDYNPLKLPPPDAPQISLTTKRSEHKPPVPKKPQHRRVTSQIGEDKAKESVDKLQKAILVLQTEKEYVKSSYESGITKYREIEKKITEMQEKVCLLEDEFSDSAVIEDDEARALMAVTALNSCNDTLVNLQEQQKRSIEETKIESEKIRVAKEKLKALRGESGQPEEMEEIYDASTTTDEEARDMQQERLELQSLCEKVNSHTTVMELAEKIDELVSKFINLELTVSSQTAQIQSLRSETDDIQKHLRRLEVKKVSSIDSSRRAEEELPKAQKQDHVKALEKMQSPKHQDQAKITCVPVPLVQENGPLKMEPQKESEVKDSMIKKTKGKVKDETLQSEPVPHLEIGGKDSPQIDPEVQLDDLEDAPNLLQLLMGGIEGKEKLLLAEYTSILQSYKETKRKLLEVEKKNQENLREMMSQVRELKSDNAIKDGEVRSLRQILSSLQTVSNSPGDLNSEGAAKQDASSGIQDRGSLHAEDEPQVTSTIEEKFRKDIDTLLDENLEFWLRFSTSFHQIQRFQTEFQTLQSETEKLKKDSQVQEGEQAGKSEATPVDKQLRELKTELHVWVEQNALLRGELQSRFSSLCNIQEEISGSLDPSSEAGGLQFTPYQAAKFQGEVLNMQQENNKVADELQAGLDHVKGLQADIDKTLSTVSKLHEKFELSGSKNIHHNRSDLKHFPSKGKGVPLKSFLYGAKPKKQSIFSCMNQAHQKKLNELRSGMPR